MAELTHWRPARGGHGLGAGGEDSTAQVRKLVEDEEVREILDRMQHEAAGDCRAVQQLADELDGKKTALQEKARETKAEAQEMMSTYLSDDVDALDGLEFLLMAEAGELGHVEIVGAMNEQAGDQRVGELSSGRGRSRSAITATRARPSLKLARSEDGLAPS